VARIRIYGTCYSRYILLIQPSPWPILLAFALGVCAAPRIPAQSGIADPEFAKVPFEQWLEGPAQTQLKWTTHIDPATLSRFQRLTTAVHVRVDGAELVRRRGKGKVMFFVQFDDEAGTAYQDHGTIELDTVREGLSAEDVIFSDSVFVVPGDYHISIAVFFTDTGEHAVRKDKLHVAPLKNDPLPHAWRDLPHVEFRAAVDPPDSWYEPAVTGRLNLQVQPKEPVRIDVVANLSPSDEAAGPLRSQNNTLSSLLPAMKTVAQIAGEGVSLDVAMLDLSRRSTVFQEEGVHTLDWTAVKTALTEANPGTIDVKALADRKQNAAFFVSEVAKRIDPAQTEKPARVLIVLTGPMSFERGQDLRPLRITPPPNCRVFYFRFAHWLPAPVRMRSRVRGRREDIEPLPPLQARRANEPDQLEPTLRPLGPRVFDVDSPESFRKALATVLAEIGRM
jgi:hypothetical protein